MATESRTTSRAATTAKPRTKDGRLGSEASPAPTTRARQANTTVGTAIGIQLDSRSVAAQTTNIMDVVDVDTAERILAEALSSTSITEMSGASTAAYVQHSDASCDPVEWGLSDFVVQVAPAPLWCIQ